MRKDRKEKHHIDLDRKNNNSENLIILDHEDHINTHKSLDRIKRRLIKTLIKKGTIKFNRIDNTYSINEFFFRGLNNG